MSATQATARGPRFAVMAPALRDAGTLIGLLLIMAVFAALTPAFLTERNLVNVLQQSSINACIAIGMTLVIISGGIDLSVGPVAALSAVIAGSMMAAGVPPALAALVALLVGAGCGAINGAFVALGGLQPFIVTLGSLSVFRALALIYTGGNPVLGVPASFRAVLNAHVAGLPVPVLLVAAISLVAWTMLRRMPLGDYLLAVGGNEEAARVAGVPVAATKIAAYTISGVLASVAAMVLVGRLGAAEPILGNLWELEAIAAAAIGGASLMGGKGSITGTLLGAVILGAMRNGLTLLNVQAFYQLLATGVIILVAMLIDRATRGRG